MPATSSSTRVGEEGQARLLAARVLVVGAGGLGAPVLLYLAAAGIGHLTIADPDTVEVSNLQRQVIHSTETIGLPKADSARAAIARLDPDLRVTTVQEKVTVANAAALIGAHDIVVDGTDNFAARYLLNDACYFARVPLVSAALLRFEGQISTYKAHEPGENRPATAACSALPRRRTWCRAASRRGSSGPSPASSAPCRRPRC
jgi:molybdopterin/thiamine biosynthesis adenylyltransferase